MCGISRRLDRHHYTASLPFPSVPDASLPCASRLADARLVQHHHRHLSWPTRQMARQLSHVPPSVELFAIFLRTDHATSEKKTPRTHTHHRKFNQQTYRSSNLEPPLFTPSSLFCTYQSRCMFFFLLKPGATYFILLPTLPPVVFLLFLFQETFLLPCAVALICIYAD